MIPSHILEKAGRLTPEERVVMETHVVYTERLIKGAVNDDVLKIAVRHHEKLDGSGYPRESKQINCLWKSELRVCRRYIKRSCQ